MTPNLALMKHYGNEHVYEAKLAGAAPFLLQAARLGSIYGRSSAQGAALQKHIEQARQMNMMLAELQTSKMDPAANLLRYTPVPRFAPEYIPPGWDQGMVRLASVAVAVGAELAHDRDFAKEAGMGDLLRGGAALAKGALAGGKGLLGGVARGAEGLVGNAGRAAAGASIRATDAIANAGKAVGGIAKETAGGAKLLAQDAAGVAKAVPGQIGQAGAGVAQKVNNATAAAGQRLTQAGQKVTNVGQVAGARAEGALTGEKLVTPLKAPVPAAAPAAAASPGQIRPAAPAPAPRPAPGAAAPPPVKPVPAAPTTQPAAPVAAPPAAAAGGAQTWGQQQLAKMKGGLGLGLKGNLAVGGLAVGGLYAGSKLLNKGSEYMSQEPKELTYGPGEGGFRPPLSTNAYGYSPSA